jgi:hypothetical protein
VPLMQIMKRGILIQITAGFGHEEIMSNVLDASCLIKLKLSRVENVSHNVPAVSICFKDASNLI